MLEVAIESSLRSDGSLQRELLFRGSGDGLRNLCHARSRSAECDYETNSENDCYHQNGPGTFHIDPFRKRAIRQ